MNDLANKLENILARGRFGEPLTLTNDEVDELREALHSPQPTDEQLYKEAMDSVTPEALARMDAKMSATPTYSMSRDYEALYEHLNAGKWALGLATFRNERESNAVKIFPPNTPPYEHRGAMIEGGGRWHFIEGASDVLQKHQLIAECQRLNLEWLSPSQGSMSAEQIMDVVKGHSFRPVRFGESADAYRNAKNEDLKARLTSLSKQTT